ncbi:MAG TPA: HAMP domain-containing sensor histidine kinase [Gemmatimonadota bacterium]|nr:HAMP domain-containing sensor histidine kinase [Gemmatimonadota bacterium]
MNRRVVPIAVAGVSAAVLLSYVAYTRQLNDALRRDARVFGRIYASAFQGVSAGAERRPELMFRILQESLNLEIPIVLTDASGVPRSAARLPFDYDLGDPASVRRVRRYVTQLDARSAPIELPEYDMVIHVGEPLFLRRLKWIPWLQAAVLLVTVLVGVWVIVGSFRGERERIWSAMARESAHQMGTPLSSLTGWLEEVEAASGRGALRRGEVDLVDEMKADVDRLLKVSHRFELIGRKPDLEPVRMQAILGRLRDYFSVRLPSLGSRVSIEIDVPEDAPPVRGNATLLEWAFENLIKNALDALAGRRGGVTLSWLGSELGRSAYRVRDTGPGVDPGLRKRLFDIGVSTKERGWGVGLSLTRRIVEDVHGGSIELEPVAEGEGASFRIELPETPAGDDAA